ncbi:NAD(P)H-hydrate dehydratase [Neotabrizicola sp. sgz301269]|uniref:NAD(P)H-hydrate dehydratase n=1 Tax=Neotabrizicola sp. sgz301269 TaxID=3276282 RepID=UPI00377036FB
MTELLTAAQMRAIEQAAIASGEVTGLELMERAGRGVVEAIFEEWPELKATSHRAVVLCGPGNNGGDGFVVARLLKGWGWEVEVFLYGDPERLPPDARVNYERWLGMGEVKSLTDEAIDGYAEDHPGTRIAIDALFGTGLVRPFLDLSRVQMELNSWQAASHWDNAFPHVVGADLPSGLCADSGRFLGADLENPFDHAPMANLTVTFHRKKNGHVLAEGPTACGRVVVKEIGLTSLSFDAAAGKSTWLITDTQTRALSKSNGHKYSHGHAFILSGPSGRGGAARLAARGALRIGAGVVTVGCPPEAIAENAARLDAVMLRGVADGAALDEVLGDARINALCLGPGMGTGAREAGLVAAALGAVRAEHAPYGVRGLVLDADALTILSRTPDLFAALHDGCVLTPHAGEFARLFPDIAEKLAAPATKGPAYSKVDATREAAARAGCVVLYKGPDTVIADPSGRCAINSAHYDRAAPWLATAGSGDVLAGFITGLLARGFASFDAACTAAWLHVECARSFGPGLIAEDLPDELPKVFRALGL